MANRDVWQGCVLSGTNTAGALKANEDGRQSRSDHLVVAARVGKEGSRKPSLLGRNHHIELITKQQNVRN